MTYYSQFQNNLIQIRERNSTIISDDNFICIYLHKSIQINKLKKYTYKLLNNTHIQLLKILEKMCKQIRTNTVSNQICNDRSGALTIKRNIKTVKQAIPRKKPVFFPENTDNMISVHIYNQLYYWFRLVMDQNRNETEEDALVAFQWEKPERKESNKNKSDTDKKDYFSKPRPRTGYRAIHQEKGEKVPVMAHYSPPEAYYSQYQYQHPYDHHYPLKFLSRNKEYCVAWTAPSQGHTA